jgi:hypothetical protein
MRRATITFAQTRHREFDCQHLQSIERLPALSYDLGFHGQAGRPSRSIPCNLQRSLPMFSLGIISGIIVGAGLVAVVAIGMMLHRQ